MRGKILVLGIIGAALATPAAADIRMEYREGMKLGDGYNVYTNNNLTSCFTGETKPEFYEATRSHSRLVEVKSAKELRTALNMSASASYKTPTGGLSGSASLISNYKSSRSSVTIAANILVLAGEESIYPTMREDVRKSVTNWRGQIDLVRLKNRCGTHYIQTIVYGGSMKAIGSQEISNSTESKEFSLKVSGSQNTFSGKFETKSELEESRFNSSMTINAVLDGGRGAAIDSIDSLRERFRNLRAEVSGEDENNLPNISKRRTVPVVVVLKDIPEFLAEADKVAKLEIGYTHLERLLDYKNQIISVAKNPQLFYVEIASVRKNAPTLEASVDRKIMELQSAISACGNADIGELNAKCDFSTFTNKPESAASLPTLYASACEPKWTAPPLTSFSALSHRSGDASMGGSDKIRITVTYVGDRGSPLQQTTKVEIFESGGGKKTKFRDEITRQFFEQTTSEEQCALASEVRLGPQPRTLNGGRERKKYKNYLIDDISSFLRSASCRSNVKGRDVGRVGCSNIEYRRIGIPLIHIEDINPAPTLEVPGWLSDAGGS